MQYVPTLLQFNILSETDSTGELLDDKTTFAAVGECDVDAVLPLGDLSGFCGNLYLYSTTGCEEQGSGGRLITSNGDTGHDLSVSFEVAITLILFIHTLLQLE